MCTRVCLRLVGGRKNMGQLRAQKGIISRVAQMARTDASLRAQDESYPPRGLRELKVSKAGTFSQSIPTIEPLTRATPLPGLQ